MSKKNSAILHPEKVTESHQQRFLSFVLYHQIVENLKLKI